MAVPASLPELRIPTPKLSPITVPQPELKQPAPIMLPPASADVATSSKTMPMPPAVQKIVELPVKAEQGLQARNSLNQSIPALSPSRPQAVPKGGLMQSIQNTTQNQRSGAHIENMNITNNKPMTPLELENMLAMAVGG